MAFLVWFLPIFGPFARIYILGKIMALTLNDYTNAMAHLRHLSEDTISTLYLSRDGLEMGKSIGAMPPDMKFDIPQDGVVVREIKRIPVD